MTTSDLVHSAARKISNFSSCREVNSLRENEKLGNLQLSFFVLIIGHQIIYWTFRCGTLDGRIHSPLDLLY